MQQEVITDQIARQTFMLWQVDPAQDTLVGNLELSGDNYDLAIGAGSAWVSVGTDDVVRQIDPTANQVASSVTVGRDPQAITYGEGAVWVANGRDGTVSRIDTETLDVTTIAVGGVPSKIAAGADGVWVVVRPQE